MPDQKILSSTARARLDELIKKYNLPGFGGTMLVKADGEWKDEPLTFGFRNVKKEPWESNSITLLASCSKVLVALSLGLLIERETKLSNGEKLSWNTKINDVLPEWKLMDGYATEHADIEDLLSMRSGVPSHNGHFGRDGETADRLIHLMRYLRPATGFRQNFYYNNGHYTLLGEIVAKLSGVRYPDFVRDNIFAPLGMNSSTFSLEEAAATGKQVSGFQHYDRDGMDSRHKFEQDAWDASCAGPLGEMTFCYEWDYTAAAGGLWSTPDDIIKWLRAMLDPEAKCSRGNWSRK